MHANNLTSGRCGLLDLHPYCACKMGPSSKTRWRLPVRLHVGWSKCFLRGYSMRELRSKIS